MNSFVRKQKYEYENREHQDWPVTGYYLDAYIENLDKSPYLREALALKNLYNHWLITVRPYELIVGRMLINEPVRFSIGSGTIINEELARQYVNSHLNKAEEEEYYHKLNRVREHKFLPPWEKDFDQYHGKLFTEEELNAINCGAASSTFFGGHLVPDFEGLIHKGLSGYKEDIKKYRLVSDKGATEFYEAMSVILEAVQSFILRMADLCEINAEGIYADHMKAMAEDLRVIAVRKPESFQQALQLVWIVHILNDSDSFGRLDKYLYPLFENDLNSGKLTRESALAILQSLMIKIDEQGEIQNMTIGGIEPDGNNGYTELTILIMEAVKTMGYKGPNLSIRINKDMPERFWDQINDNLETGQGLPALYNEDVMINWFTALGISESDSMDFCLAGCSQAVIPGKSQFVNDIGLMNISKILELTLYNGVDFNGNGFSFPLKTGDAETFHSFNEFMNAFKKQLAYYAKMEADINNKVVGLFGKTEGYTLRSLFTEDCLKNGKGIFEGGAKYNHIQLECIGMTNAADSLAAIKKAVFDEKRLTLNELKRVLSDNFAGHENLRSYLKNKVPKFGNGDDFVDDIRSEITKFLFNELRTHKALLGGIFIPGEVIFISHEYHGSLTGATPDGRKSGEVLADSAGASQGADKNGPTSLMRSVLRIPADQIVTSIVLNLKFIKSQWPTHKDKAKMLFKTFFASGGQQIQINVCDNKILKAAYERPEDYPNLVVRVGGYSAYFSSLSKKIQQDIIDRTENELS